MIVLFSSGVGALWGGYLAKRRGGNRLDIAQYAASLAILLGVAGLFITIAVHRALI